MSALRLLLPIIIVSIVLISGCVNNNTSTPADWPQSGYDPAQTGQSPYNGPTEKGVEWKYTMAGGWGSSVAVGNDGSLYFSYTIEGKTAVLVALNNDGTERWKKEADAFSGPSIGKDNTLFVGRRDGDTSTLMAYNSEGSGKWSFNVGNELISPNMLIDRNGDIYFLTGKGDDWYSRLLKLYSIRPDGTKKWSVQISGSGYISTPAIFGDTIYAGGDPLKAFDKSDGSLKWEFDIQTLVGIFGPAVGPDGTIYTAARISDNINRFYAINPDGTEKWSLKTGFLEMTPAIASDGTVYFHSWPSPDPKVLSSGLFAVNPDGSLKWSLKDFIKVDSSLNPDRDLYPPGSDSSPIIGADGIIYMGSDVGSVYAIKPDGALLWEYVLGFEFDTRPSIGSDGTLYICNSGGPGNSNCFAISNSGNPDPGDPWEGYVDVVNDEDNNRDNNLLCHVKYEKGRTCDSSAKCSTGEFIEGCCIEGTCSV